MKTTMNRISFPGKNLPAFLSLLILSWLNCFSSQAQIVAVPENVQAEVTAHWTIAVHAGAGGQARGSLTPGQEQAYQEALREALNTGSAILAKGGSSLDAVEAAVRFMEDHPLFNAGKGAVLNADGQAELDASIMDGRTGMAGAVAGVTTVKNPILAARAVMEQSPHVLLVGKGAEEFARTHKLEIVDPSYFITPGRMEAWRNWKGKDLQVKPKGAAPSGLKEKETGKDQLREAEKAREIEKTKEIEKAKEIEKQKDQEKKKEEGRDDHGTVGAVAVDSYGNLAAATSTGGMMGKMAGRVGDSPLIGAGTYAGNSTCAVSATGHGEFFIRSVVAYDVSALMEYRGVPLEEAAKIVVMEKLVRQKGSGGVIAVDREGNVAMPFNTSSMYRGFMRSSGETAVELY